MVAAKAVFARVPDALPEVCPELLRPQAAKVLKPGVR